VRRVLTFGGFREIRGDVDEWHEDDVDTVVDGRGRHDDSAVVDSPTEKFPPAEAIPPSDEGDKTIVVAAEEHGSHLSTDSTAEEAQTDDTMLNWANEGHDSCQYDCTTPVKSHNREKDSAIANPPLSETWINASLPSPISASSPTWAEVAASPVKNQSHDDKLVEIWGDVSGKSWEWERNWR
jgi:hypothetical protein